jgi:hypothetical protein
MNTRQKYNNDMDYHTKQQHSSLVEDMEEIIILSFSAAAAAQSECKVSVSTNRHLGVRSPDRQVQVKFYSKGEHQQKIEFLLLFSDFHFHTS